MVVVVVHLYFEGEIVKQPAKKDIHSFDVDISPDQTAYCYVLRPDQSKSVFPQHENCDFPKFNHESEGNGIWHVVSGIKGITQEVSFEVNVQTNGKQLNRKENEKKKKLK